MKKLLTYLLLTLMLVTPLLGAAALATEPTTEGAEPVTEPTTGEPTTGEPVTGEPTTEESTTEEPTTGEPTTEEPATGEPTTGEPTTGEPTTGEPTTGEPTTEEPVAEETIAEESAIMLASEPVAAQSESETCAHEYVITERSGVLDNNECVSKDENVHTMTSPYMKTVICGDCGEELSTQYGEYTYTEPHEFEDGVCWVCGYPQKSADSCAHEFVNVSTEYDWDSVKYDAVDETTHTRSVPCTVIIYCDSCGAELSKETLTNTEEQNHDFGDSGNVCHSCGYIAEKEPEREPESKCTHEYTHRVQYDGKIIGYKMDDADGHIVKHLPYTNTYCSTCGELLKTEYDDTPVEKKERHQMYNGVCEYCGYKPAEACEHKNRVIEEADGWMDFGYTQDDENGHFAKMGERYYVYCVDCGEELGMENPITVEKESHSFDANGVCVYCGYKNTCAHENQESDWYETDERVTAVNDQMHSYKYHRVDYVWCTICGQTLSETTSKEWTTVTDEPHEFSSDGSCWKCGFDRGNACKHENTVENTYDNGNSYGKGDQNGHIWYYHTVKEVYCEDCGEVLSSTLTTEEQLSRIEPHSFENGVCTVCGFKNTCAHEHTETVEGREDAIYEAVDQSGHTANYCWATGKYCTDCGEVVEWTYDKDKRVTETEAHEFEDGVCWMCGFKNTCEHKNQVNKEYVVDARNYTSLNEKEHSYEYLVADVLCCDDCGEELSQWKERENWETEPATVPHFFEDGKCVFCGYVQPTATVTPTPTMPAVTDTPIVTATPEPTATATSAATAKTTATAESTATPAPAFTEVSADEAVHGVKAADELKIVETMIIVADSVEGTPTTIEILHADKVLTADELAALEALPLKEQLLTFLSSIGFEEQVNRAIDAGQATLSDSAIALKETILARVAAMDDTAKAEFEALLQTYFPKITENGQTYFTIDLKATTDGATRVERYTFRQEGDDWIFTLLEVAN